MIRLCFVDHGAALNSWSDFNLGRPLRYEAKASYAGEAGSRMLFTSKINKSRGLDFLAGTAPFYLCPCFLGLMAKTDLRPPKL